MKMRQDAITISAPGKIHLMGEHAVVYGKPALLAAINKRCNVQVLPSETDRIRISSQNLKQTVSYSYKQIEQLTDEAQKQWKALQKNNNTASLHSLTLMGFSAIAIGETLHFLKQTSLTGFDLIIDSDIPLGSGLGSSAALSVAIVAATMIFLRKKVDKKTVNKIAFIIEQKKHGRPSGGDNAVACFGGMLRFQKLAHAKTAAQKTFTVKKKLTGSFFLIDSGRPVESTGEMVSNVNNLKSEKKDMFENFLQRQEKVTNALLPALQEGNEEAVKLLITEGERNLEQIGVVSDSAKALIAMVEKKGGAAKICGAGGRKKGSGMLLVYHPQREQMKQVLLTKKIPFYDIMLGSEGVMSN